MKEKLGQTHFEIEFSKIVKKGLKGNILYVYLEYDWIVEVRSPSSSHQQRIDFAPVIFDWEFDELCVDWLMRSVWKLYTFNFSYLGYHVIVKRDQR